MPSIIAVPFVLTDALLTVGADNYETGVSSVLFTPTANIVTWLGLTPASAFSGPTNPTWACTINYAQDWKTANSLPQYLLANTGQSKVVTFRPQAAVAGSAIFTATLIMVPGPIGGDVNTVLVGSVTLGVIGAPVKTAAP